MPSTSAVAEAWPVTVSPVLGELLLAIIRAHAPQDCDNRQRERLKMALEALTGQATPAAIKMEQALLYMERLRQQDVCDAEMRSLQTKEQWQAQPLIELAEQAASDVLGLTSNERAAAARTLSDLFQARRYSSVVTFDHVEEMRQAEALQRICDDLAEWGIATRL